MDPRPNIDAGRIGIFHRQIGPGPVAFAFGAAATAGLALRSGARRGGCWGLLAGVTCRGHGTDSLTTVGHRLPGDLMFHSSLRVGGRGSDAAPLTITFIAWREEPCC